MRNHDFGGCISFVETYPWALTKEEMNDLYNGKYEKVNAKKTLILEVERRIDELRKVIEVIKSV